MKQTILTQVLDIFIIIAAFTLFLLKVYAVWAYALLFVPALFSSYLKYKNSTSAAVRNTVLVKIAGLAIIGALFWYYQTYR